MRHENGSRSFEGNAMKVFAISDLHLSINNPKPMDIFGPVWDNYVDKIFADWKAKVSENDIVLLAGDFSWAMQLEDAMADFEMLKNLPGKKVIIRGNHDYWWKSISAVRNALPEGFYAIQNDSLRFDGVVICGTRGWIVPDGVQPFSEENQKIYDREVIRLELTLKSAEKIKQEDDQLICMMHYPPTNYKREDSKFTELINTFKVDAVVYGHLHAKKKQLLASVRDDVKYFLTSCDMTENRLIEICEV